jgi:hypothetical protein
MRSLGDWQFSGRLVVAIPDATRPLDPIPALRLIAERASNITQVVVGLGLHRQMETLSGWKEFPTIQHNPDDCISTQVVRGVPGFVHRSFAKAEASLSIGIAELHQYAGFSGGYKGVSVGCGGRETILALHHRDQILAKGVRIGSLEGNPFRALVDDLGEAAGCQWALNYAPALKKWFFGHPREILREISEQSNPWYSVPQRVSSVLLQVPTSKGKSLYQASRAASYLALSPSPPLKKKAILCIEASMEEGLGTEEGFVQVLTQLPYPWSDVLSGTPPKGAGAQRAIILAKLCQQYELRLYGVRNPSVFHQIGLNASAQPAPRESIELFVSNPFHRLPQLVSL